MYIIYLLHIYMKYTAKIYRLSYKTITTIFKIILITQNRN